MWGGGEGIWGRWKGGGGGRKGFGEWGKIGLVEGREKSGGILEIEGGREGRVDRWGRVEGGLEGVRFLWSGGCVEGRGEDAGWEGSGGVGKG